MLYHSQACALPQAGVQSQVPDASAAISSLRAQSLQIPQSLQSSQSLQNRQSFQSPQSLQIPQAPFLRIPDGILLQNRFRIDGLIGEGGMGRVYMAYDVNFRHRVAVKEMLITASTIEELRQAKERFARESRILFSLRHHRIPAIYDFFSMQNRCFIAMEFIEGETLAQMIARSALFNEDLLIELAVEICDILSYLHSRNPPLVFRDLKPQNLMVSRNEGIFLVDFGIAREVTCRTGTAIGTIGYAAPEVYSGHLDTRSDLYSMGAVLHYALTGRDPESQTPFTFHQNPISDYRTVRYRWQDLLDTLLAMKPEGRFRSAGEVRRALEKIRKISPQASIPVCTKPALPTAPPATRPAPVATACISSESTLPSSCRWMINSLDGAAMIFIPDGEFLMGSLPGEGSRDEQPSHRVCLNAYWLYKYPVINRQFMLFTQQTGYKAEGDWKRSCTSESYSHPVVRISWNDADAYCRWVRGVLPSEAEWEFAARGSDGRLYPWGNEWDEDRCRWSRAHSVAKIRKAKSGTTLVTGCTAQPGTYPEGVSPFGLHDMAGNVWEWCSDWYDERYYQGSSLFNPPGPPAGIHKVVRGGSWFTENPQSLTTTARFWKRPELGDDTVGFRVKISRAGP